MSYFERLSKAWTPALETDVRSWVPMLREAKHWPIYVLGNGGSQATAQHLVLHLRENGILADDLLADNAYLTMMANDYNYNVAPTRMVLKMAGSLQGSVFVISGSGNSENVVRLLAASSYRPTYALLGMGGGRAKELAKNRIVVPSDDYGIIEDIHLSLVHIMAEVMRGQG